MEERENKKLGTILNYAIIVCIAAILIMIICGIVGKFLDKKTNRIGEFSERHPRLNMVIALALVVIMGTAGYVSIYYIVCKVKEIIHWIADMASKMDAVVIVALITGTVSIIGVIISSIVAKIIDYKKSRQEYLAKKREIPYGEFVEMIYKVQGNIKSEGSYTEKMMMDDLSKFSKQITLWGSSRVVNKWVKFREEGANPNAKSDNLFLINNDKGLNEAGTFKLLCPTCDGKIFQDYENLEALKEVPSERMLEEIALKNVLLMLNKRYTEIELYNNLLKESKIPYPFDKKQEVNSLDERDYFWDFNRIKEIMKENGEKCEFKLFYCKHLDYTVPIAFQGAITLYGDLKGNIVTDIYNTSEEVIVKHMHICVFPLDIGSVVFAFYNKADTEYDSFVNQFNELDDDEKMRIISYIIYEYSEDMLTAKKFPHRTWFLNKMEVTFRETTEIFALSKEMAQEMQREKVKALQNIEKDFPCILSEKFAVKK